jgi:hypothetical protein
VTPIGSLLLGTLATPYGPRPALVVSSIVPLLVAWWLYGTLRPSVAKGA